MVNARRGKNMIYNGLIEHCEILFRILKKKRKQTRQKEQWIREGI
jgi:hypothetical protein